MNVTGDNGNTSSIRKQVFKLLDKNPLLTASSMAKMLELTPVEYQKQKGYLRKLKADWKRYHVNERGSNGSIRNCPDEVHNAYFEGKVKFGVGKLSLDMWKLGLPAGWFPTKSRNGFLIFKGSIGLGWVRLYRTGTVELFVRKPANDGKCMQLFCDAFTKTGLIDSIRLVEDFQKTLMRRMHATFDTGMKQKYMKITAFSETHKFTFVAGDRTHPTCFEFMFEYQNEVVQARMFMEKLGEAFGLLNNNPVGKGVDKRIYE
jgi:hypothetical protein